MKSLLILSLLTPFVTGSPVEAPEAPRRPNVVSGVVAAGGEFQLTGTAVPGRGATVASGGSLRLVTLPSAAPSPASAETPPAAKAGGGCPCQTQNGDAIFDDGFETGGTGAWAATQN